MKDAFDCSVDYPFSSMVLHRPRWWKKMQRWPLSWVLHAMIFLRLTGLRYKGKRWKR
ncbi:hypothetical protein LCGC14_2154460 [marine sediment metagenome]|uniref:Uncharacterized protein n=1 Tax=marine sediment metagenome TaxID=412755 RepID=A0A0F9EGU2_9ZZZZ